MLRIREALLRWGWLLVIALSPLFVFPTAALTPVLLAAPLLVWAHNKKRTPFDWPVLLLAVMMLVSLYATYDITVSLPKIAGMLLGFAAYYVTVAWADRPRGGGVAMAAFLAVGAGVAVVGALGMQVGSKIAGLAALTAWLPSRLISLPGAESGLQPNEVAGALLWVIPLWGVAALGQARRAWASRRWSDRLAALGMFAVLSWVLATFMLAQSRGSYAALALTAAAMAWMVLPRVGRWAAVGAVVLALAAGGLWLRAQTAGGLPLRAVLPLSQLDSRMEIWSRGLYALQDFPFTGMGMNTFRHLLPVLYPLLLIEPGRDLGHAHNEFLQAGLDLGVPGLIAFLALYLGAFWMLFEIWQSRGRGASQSAIGNPQSAIALGLGGGLLAHFLYGIVDAIALGAKPGVLFWMLLGLIAALYQRFR
ncbi:MAG: O-antigen ligase family protein [Chloroflexi bacterium]|nr:O-antigen ligase family protein [Chloroflexota bacterium]